VLLLKQVEQVTILVLEGPARRFARIPSMGITGAAEVLVFITAIMDLAVISLQKQPGGAEGVRLRRAVRECYRPHPAVPTNRATELPSLLLATSGRQLHNSVLLPKPDLFGIGAR
jgi:hypothetical protein